MRKLAQKINKVVVGKDIERENKKNTAEKLKGLHFCSNVALAVLLALPSVLMCFGYNKLYLMDPENPYSLPAMVFFGVIMMIPLIRVLLAAYTVRELEIKAEATEAAKEKKLRLEQREKHQFELDAELNADFDRTLEIIREMKEKKAEAEKENR